MSDMEGGIGDEGGGGDEETGLRLWVYFRVS